QRYDYRKAYSIYCCKSESALIHDIAMPIDTVIRSDKSFQHSAAFPYRFTVWCDGKFTDSSGYDESLRIMNYVRFKLTFGALNDNFPAFNQVYHIYTTVGIMMNL